MNLSEKRTLMELARDLMALRFATTYFNAEVYCEEDAVVVHTIASAMCKLAGCSMKPFTLSCKLWYASPADTEKHCPITGKPCEFVSKPKEETDKHGM